MCFYPLKTFLNLLKLYPIAVGVSKREFAPLVVQEGSETQSKGCPTVLSPISVRTEIGCPHGISAFIPHYELRITNFYYSDSFFANSASSSSLKNSIVSVPLPLPEGFICTFLCISFLRESSTSL